MNNVLLAFLGANELVHARVLFKIKLEHEKQIELNQRNRNFYFIPPTLYEHSAPIFSTRTLLDLPPWLYSWLSWLPPDPANSYYRYS